MSDKPRSRVERKQIKNEQQNKEKNNGTTGKPKMSFWRKFLLICMTLAVTGILVGLGTFFWLIRDVPTLDETILKDPVSSTVFDSTDNKTKELGKEKREEITYEEIPKVLEQAVLATEDVRFYDHSGIDVIRILGATVANFKEGFGSQGGSTITQQVIKNSFNNPEKTIKRKVQEWYLAIKLEREFSKQQILAMYLNKIYFSKDLYGVAKASEFYFGLKKEDLHKMTLEQAAILAGMPQSPNNYNPVTNPEKSQKRRNIVLSNMEKNGAITTAQMTAAQNVPIADTLNVQQAPQSQYQAFIDTVVEEVQEKLNVNVYEDGLKIYTTLNTSVQDATDAALKSEELGYPNAQMEAGIAVTDTQTGEIRAIGGGRNYQAKGQNKATHIQRQPGSTIKPVLDYGPAIEKFKWSTDHLIVDEPYSYNDKKKTPIRNADRKFDGAMTMRTAITKSKNVPAVKTIQEVGLSDAQDFAAGLGIPLPDQIYEPYAIGGFATGVSPMDMAGAFASFGNGGVYNEPHAIRKVVFPDGREVDLTPKPKKAMNDYTAFLITDMLRDVVTEGTGVNANVGKFDIAGKTGTTNFDDADVTKYNLPAGATLDSWFVGYTPQYSIGVWTGYDTKSNTNYLDRNSNRIAAKIFKSIISQVGTDTSRFKQPNSVVQSGKEYYVKGSPDKNIIKQTISKVDGLNAAYDKPSASIKLSWSYTAPADETPAFDVSYTVDGGAAQSLGTISELGTSVPNAKPGSSYTFTVVASTSRGKSEPATITVVVPKEELPPEPVIPPGTNPPGVEDPNKPVDPSKPPVPPVDPNKPPVPPVDPNKPPVPPVVPPATQTQPVKPSTEPPKPSTGH